MACGAFGEVMSIYKDPRYLQVSSHAAFDVDHQPGQKPPYSGIYRCMGCGREIVAEQSGLFPPQNHHEHSLVQRGIRWRLIVCADHRPKS